jgi:integrase
VPLSPRAVEILRNVAPLRDKGDSVFPSPIKTGQPLSDAALLQLAKSIAGETATVHGFRSSFRNWAGAVSRYPFDVCEFALAHVVTDKTVKAYLTDDLFDKRRPMMADWARYCDTVAANNVVPLRRRASR